MQRPSPEQFAAQDTGSCIIMNANSGKRDADGAPGQIRAALREVGLKADLKIVRHGSEIIPAAKAALGQGYGTIVAAGGDGTISAVASVLNGSGVRMGVLPLGTFNYFARSLGVPEDLGEAVRLLATGQAHPVSVGTINGRVFLNNASLGAYPAILKTREETYRKWGRSRVAAYWSVIVALVTLRKPLHLSIEANGQTTTRRTPLIFAVNNAYQLQQLGLQGEEEIAAGRLAVFIAPDTSRWGMLKNAVLLALGLAQKDQTFDLVADSKVRITDSGKSYDIACDGERDKMRAPYDLQVHPGALQVIAPEAAAGEVR